MSFLESIRKNYVFIPSESSRINTKMGGIHLGAYYVIAAPPKAGKTTFIDSMFLIPYIHDSSYRDKLRFLYFNLEMPEDIKILSIAVSLVNRKYDTAYKAIDVVKESTPHDDIIEKAVGYVNRLIEDRFIMMYSSARISDIYNTCESMFNEDKDRHYIVIIDHMRRVHVPYDDSMKAKIDLLSKKIVSLRNKYRQTFVGVIHTNRNFSLRKVKNDHIPVPLAEDIKETGNLSEDADYILTMMNPHTLDVVVDASKKKIMGIPIEFIPESGRILSLVESRYANSPQIMLLNVDIYKHKLYDVSMESLYSLNGL